MSESEPEYDQAVIPTSPLTPLAPQHDPYPFTQGNWYWSYPIASPSQEVRYNLPAFPTPVPNVQEHSPMRNETYSRPPQAMSPELLYGQDYLQFMQQQQYIQKPLYNHGQNCMNPNPNPTPNPGWQCSDAKRPTHPGDGMGCCILY